MNPRGPEFDQILERVLDGRASAGDRALVEREMVQDAELRRAVEMQRAVDQGLRRMFEQPETAASPETALRRGAGSIWKTRRSWMWGAAAAATVVIAVGAWWTIFVRQPKQGTLYDLYTQEVAAGFAPEIPCRTERDFKLFTLYAVNQTMRVPPASVGPGNVDLLGWSYRKAFSPSTSVLLARVKGRDVVVLMDKASSCDAPIPPPNDPKRNKVHIYRRQVGTSCVYELSELDAPAVIDLLEPLSTAD